MSGPGERTSGYRTRLFIGFLVVIALFAGTWAWSLFAPLSEVVQSQQRVRLTDIARAGAVAVSLTSGPFDETVSDLASDGDIRFTLIAEDGAVLADTQEDASALDNHADRPEVRQALAGATGYDVRRSATQDLYRVYVAVPGTTADGDRVVLRTSETLDDIAAVSAQARRVGLLPLAVLLPISVGAAWWLARYASRPVERLAEAALAMADGNLSSPVPDERGPLRPLSSALNALREQLRTRLADLEAEQDALRTALNGLPDGILVLEEDRVALTNKALAAIFRLAGPKAETLAALGLPAPIEAAIEAHRDAADPHVIDVGPDPFKRYHKVTVIPIGVAGERRTLIAIQDVSELMRLDAVRTEFVANASHELKTPTASILLLAQSANQAEQDGDSRQALTFLSQVSAEADRLRRLVADLLDLSRLESTPAEEEVTDVRRAVELGAAAHSPSARAKGLTLTADLEGVKGQDVAVWCDATDLAVALDNLLANAVTYTETGGVRIAVDADEKTVRISVSDTGIGIPEADVERVFERFYRVDRARSRTSGGTGLGLSLVRNIAERAGGAVNIKSDTGEGTTVTLALRRAR